MECKQQIKTFLQRETFHNRSLSRLAEKADWLVSMNGQYYTPYLISILRRNVNDTQRSDKAYMKELVRDLRFSRAYYGSSYREYFLFRFQEHTELEKLQYVCWTELKDYYNQINRIGRPEIFDNKLLTFNFFHDFYHRDICVVKELNDRSSFTDFIQQHKRFIIKPINEFGGKGVEIIELKESLTPEAIWYQTINRIPFLAEELICQSQEISKFYPHSVNTVRYNTFFHEGRLKRLQAAFRIGRGGSIVDNATSGGIYTLVDTDSGRILCPARSDFGEQFEVHPDTGVRFEGNQIPRWNELNGLLDRIVRVVPKQKLVGWDFALSKDGWVLVEGNTRPALQSFDLDHGLRQFLKDSFGNAIRMWE